MANVEINATVREVNGKGASRRLRKTGLVPGILYGGVEEAKVIELDHKMLLMELITSNYRLMELIFSPVERGIEFA